MSDTEYSMVNADSFGVLHCKRKRTAMASSGALNTITLDFPELNLNALESENVEHLSNSSCKFTALCARSKISSANKHDMDTLSDETPFPTSTLSTSAPTPTSVKLTASIYIASSLHYVIFDVIFDVIESQMAIMPSHN